MTTRDTVFFSPNYETARRRFRLAAENARLQVETHTIASPGPDAMDLSIDVAIAGGAQARQALILSSGLHGVEGFLGSAIQLAILERWLADASPPPPLKLILMHALNPFGFAWRRRVNEDLRCGKVMLVFGPCADARQTNGATALMQKQAAAR